MSRLTEERMARYGKEHKLATRQRIIETAGRRLKRDGIDGIDGSGVATLMADAGLTTGAFYAHFVSKEDLVATAVSGQLRDQCERPAAVAPGCPSAALLDEIGRCAESARRAYTDSVLGFIDDFAARLAPHDPASARTTVLSVYALMVGILQCSRALADRELSDAVLEQGIHNALAVLNVRHDR